MLPPLTKSSPGHGLASTDTLSHRAGTCTEHPVKPLRGSMASHWGPSAQPSGVTHLPQLSCHLGHTDGLTSVTPHPSPDPAVILSPLTRPWSPSDIPTVPMCPCPQEGDIVPLLSHPRSHPPAQPGRTCPASPRVWGCHGHPQGVATGLGVTWRGHPLFGLPEWDRSQGDGMVLGGQRRG